MENRTRLRVQKTKDFKNGKKHLVKRVVDYLKSDTFLYAPLLSTVPSHFRSPDTLSYSTRVVEFKNSIMENKPFLGQLGDYIKSDDYMYAPVAGPPPSLQGAESLLYSERIRMSVSTTRLTMKANQPADHLGNANVRSENHLPRSGPSDQHPRAHRNRQAHCLPNLSLEFCSRECHPQLTFNSSLLIGTLVCEKTQKLFLLYSLFWLYKL